MKLISCHVEGFGKIRDKNYDFNSQITSINERNGFGKSTLAAFIKAMFYGLEGYKENTAQFVDRQHYYPFDGGSFGGNLTFEVDDKIYKIERFFGEKSSTKDTLKLYLNGHEIESDTDLGKTFFSIDKQSFERTAFIDSGEIEVKSTSSINLKLNGFLQGGDLSVDIDDALERLDRQAKLYKKSKKGKDEISDLTEKINNLSEKIANAKSVQTALEDKYLKHAKLKNEISVLTKEISKAQEINAVISDFEHLESLQSTLDEANAEIENLTAKYNGLVPSEAEARKTGELLVEQREIQAKTSSDFSENEEIKLNRLTEIFSKAELNSEVISKVESDVYNLSSIVAKIDQLKNNGLTDADIKIINTFKSNPPTNDKLQSLEALVNEYKVKKTTLDITPEFSYKASVKSNPLTIIFAIISAILMVVGLVNISNLVGIVLTVISLIGLISCLVIYFNGRANKPSVINPEKKLLELSVKDLEDKIKSVLFPYGYYSGNGVLFDYATFISDVKRYNLLSNSLIKCENDIVSLESERNNITKKLNAFFNAFGLTGDNYISNITRLQSGFDEYNNLQKRKADKLSENKQILTRLSEIENEISIFSKKHGLSSVVINDIYMDISLYKNHVETVSLTKAKIESFVKEKNLTEKPSSKIDIASKNEELTALQESLSALNHEIFEDEYLVEKLDGYVLDKQALSDKLEDCKQKHKLLVASYDFLVRAEQNLKDKYVKPVRDEFVKYAKLLEDTLGEKITMTKDFELRFERNGKERSDKHLSSGIKSICALCFRLALIKNMYLDKKPFLILDDPFVNLDEEHFEKVKSVIYKLSKDMQIIYFTCHKSRMI